MIKTIYKLEEAIDFAWELSKNDLFASYHRKKSKEELKEAFEKALSTDKQNIIACYREAVLCGVCIYFWKCEEKYAQTIQFLIGEDYNQTAEEFIDYISKQLTGYELFIGVPFTNKNANQYFEKKNAKCIESSIDTRLYNLQLQTNEKNEQIEEIAISNFEEYAKFHDKHAVPLEMYYNSKNLLKDIERFRIFALRESEEIHASIFVKTSKNISEIFGLFIDKEYKDNGIEGDLVNEVLMRLYNEFGTVKEVVYFIDEESQDELNSALKAGFQVQDQYRCYKLML